MRNIIFHFFFSLVDVRAGILVQEIKLVRSYWLTGLLPCEESLYSALYDSRISNCDAIDSNAAIPSGLSARQQSFNAASVVS